MLAGPSESQAAAGIVTAMLTALAGSALPGPGSTIRAISVQIKGSLPIATAMTARLIVREKRTDLGTVVLEGQCTDPSGRVVATAILDVLAPTTRQQYQIAEHRLEGADRALPESQAHADRRRASLQRRCAVGRGGGRRGRVDPTRFLRSRGRDRADCGPCGSEHRQVPDRGRRGPRGLGAEGGDRCGRRRDRGADEGEPAHRRVPARGHAKRSETARRATAQPLHDGVGSELCAPLRRT